MCREYGVVDATISPMCAPYADYAHIIVIICCLILYSVCTLRSISLSSGPKSIVHTCMHAFTGYV